jgi:ABC-type glycerol-3-phosphate transport system substrate-binding protein
MPVGIANYNLCTQIYSAAPEISGLWGMTMVPGTLKEDGTIDRTQTFGSTANIILAGAKDPDSAWRFLDWYTSATTQAEYANELESTMGMTARYATANLEAFKLLNWSREDAASLRAQRDWVITYPNLPGGYYVARNYTNAFNAVISDNEAPRSAMVEWTKQTNAELNRKRIEFGIDELKFEAKGGWEE